MVLVQVLDEIQPRYRHSKRVDFTLSRGLRFIDFLPFCGKKTQGIENRSELQNLNFEPGEGPLQMTDPANGVLSSGKDL